MFFCVRIYAGISNVMSAFLLDSIGCNMNLQGIENDAARGGTLWEISEVVLAVAT